MNDKMSYRTAIEQFSTEEEHVKTLVIAHLMAFNQVDKTLVVRLQEMYRLVDTDFIEKQLELDN